MSFNYERERKKEKSDNDGKRDGSDIALRLFGNESGELLSLKTCNFPLNNELSYYESETLHLTLIMKISSMLR